MHLDRSEIPNAVIGKITEVRWADMLPLRFAFACLCLIAEELVVFHEQINDN